MQNGIRWRFPQHIFGAADQSLGATFLDGGSLPNFLNGLQMLYWLRADGLANGAWHEAEDTPWGWGNILAEAEVEVNVCFDGYRYAPHDTIGSTAVLCEPVSIWDVEPWWFKWISTWILWEVYAKSNYLWYDNRWLLFGAECDFDATFLDDFQIDRQQQVVVARSSGLKARTQTHDARCDCFLCFGWHIQPILWSVLQYLQNKHVWEGYSVPDHGNYTWVAKHFGDVPDPLEILLTSGSGCPRWWRLAIIDVATTIQQWCLRAGRLRKCAWRLRKRHLARWWRTRRLHLALWPVNVRQSV